MVLFSWHINLTRFQGFLLFTPRLGEMVANLTTIFFHKCVGFNHQLVSDVYGSAFFGTSLESTASHRQFRPKLGLQKTYTGNLPFLGSEKDLRNGRERKDSLGWRRWVGGFDNSVGGCEQLNERLVFFGLRFFFHWDNDLNNQKDSCSMCFVAT